MTLRVKTASRLYYSFGSDLIKKYATDLRRFFSPAGRPSTGVDDSCKIGSLSLKGRCHGNKFSSFSDISAGADAIFVMLRSQSFDLFYSGKLVVDSFRIVELLQICQGLVVQLVVNLL